MNKKLEIKIKIDSKFEIEANPNLKDWNDSSEESKQYYVKERIKEFLLEHIDDIVDDLLDNSKIEF
jgi:hypothetical protein